MMTSDQFEYPGTSYLDIPIIDDDMEVVMECCEEWGITISNSTIDGRHRFWGPPEELHVLRNSFS